MGRLSTRNGPLVVVDRCVLTFGRVEDYVPRGAQLVLPDTFITEALRGDISLEGPAFNAWLRKHGEHVFVARYWDELSRAEVTPGTCVDPRRIIHEEYSNHLQRSSTSGLDWSRSGELPELHEKEKAAAMFAQHAEKYARNVRPEIRASLKSDEDAVRIIQQPGFMTEFIQMNNPDKVGPSWTAALAEFPDRHAIGRYGRLVGWYVLQRLLGRSKKFESDFFDADYAFVASYVGRLATNDKGMIRAVRAVFPYVQILSSVRPS